MAIAERELLTPRHNRLYTEEEYLALEEAAEEKSEYVDGRLLLMSGGSAYHGMIGIYLGAALIVALGTQDCSVLSSDVKVRASGQMYYPDVSIVCGDLLCYAGRNDVVTNPILVAEVSSPSKEGFDRSRKMRDYLEVPSLEVYLLASQNEPRLEMFSRQEDRTWRYETAAGMNAALTIPALSISLKLSDVYRRVVFEAAEEL